MDNSAFKFMENLGDIDESAQFSGYLWLVDQACPIEIDGKISDKIDLSQMTQLPFIIEGHLIARGENPYSLSIRFMDGRYIIGRVNWKAVADQKIQCREHKYISHGFKDNRKICFKEALIPVSDPLCQGMPVLQPAWIAFTGFEPGQKEDKKNESTL